VRIVLDTLGSDNPPAEIIKGGVEAAKAFQVEMVFSGDGKLIEEELKRYPNVRFSIIHAPEIITMEDSPAEAVRRKKDSSLVRGIEALKEGTTEAFVSPANTGAVMAASLLKLGRIPGIDRPGIAAVIPTLQGGKMLLIDVGANTDCTPENIKQFAIMGKVYCQEILRVENPTVGLRSIGAEKHKGNKLVQKTFALLESLEGFVGNVESNWLLRGEVDVVVCDGFVGNICLKAYEGCAEATIALLQKAIRSSWLAKLGALFLKPVLKDFKQEMSASRYGGAPLLGVRGTVIIAHGHSDHKAIKNAIGVAVNSVEHKLVEKIEQGILKYAETPCGSLQRTI